MNTLRILFVRDDTFHYIAKIYWSLQNGLKQNCELVSYGINQDFYNPKIKTYDEIIKLIYGDNNYPDIIITDFKSINYTFKYKISEKIKNNCLITFILGDFWNTSTIKLKEISDKYFDFIITLFYDSFSFHKTISNKFIWCPPSIDPYFFKDWNLKKEYLIGFLGRGCDNPKDFRYPERYKITQLLNQKYKNLFYTNKYPGWGYFKNKNDLVGQNFSQAINKCEMFISTSGNLKHCNPKYFEIMASGSLLLAGDCNYLEKNRFTHEFNCIKFKDEKDLISKIDYFRIHKEQLNNIIYNGLSTIQKYHLGNIRAKNLISEIKNRFNI